MPIHRLLDTCLIGQPCYQKQTFYLGANLGVFRLDRHNPDIKQATLRHGFPDRWLVNQTFTTGKRTGFEGAASVHKAGTCRFIK